MTAIHAFVKNELVTLNKVVEKNRFEHEKDSLNSHKDKIVHTK